MSTRPRDTRTTTTSTAVARPGTQLRELDHAGLVWVDVIQPTAADITELRERFGYDALSLDSILNGVRRPRLEVHLPREYVFVEIHVPIFDREGNLMPSEVAIYAGSAGVVMIHDGTLKPLRRIFSAAASNDMTRAQMMGRGPGYLLFRILDALLKQVFPTLYRTDDAMAKLDGQLQGNSVAAATELARVRRDTITIRSIIRPNQAVTAGLQQLDAPFLRIDAAHVFGNNTQLALKANELLDEQAAVLAGIQETLNTFVLDRNGQQLRFISLLLIILIPILLLAALAALQTAIPVLERPLVFAGAILATIALSVGLIALLRSRHYL